MNPTSSNSEPDAQETPPEGTPRKLQVTETAWLAENDCFGTRAPVVILKLFYGGNALVWDEVDKRERHCGVANLTPRESAPAPPPATPLSAGEDRYYIGELLRKAYLKHGKDSWCSIADEVIAALSRLPALAEEVARLRYLDEIVRDTQADGSPVFATLSRKEREKLVNEFAALRTQLQEVTRQRDEALREVERLKKYELKG